MESKNDGESTSGMCRILLYVQHNLNKDKLIRIYGDDLGGHLWGKFIYHDRNLLTFINYLDSVNRNKFMDNHILFEQNYKKNI